MITREEYKKTLIRMFNSVRDKDYKFERPDLCNGVKCTNCPLNKTHCMSETRVATSVFDIIETVEKWGKEHPVVTNAKKFYDMFEETFGIDLTNELSCDLNEELNICELVSCPKEQFYGGSCDGCEYKNFWDKEYEEPKAKE